jgi:signal transduction histidine kinase
LILRQTIINLLDNAIKYSPAESHILVRVEGGTNDEVFLEVVDQDREFPANISRMFSTASTAWTKRGHGSGAAQASDCPLPAGPSKRMAAKSV